MCFLTCRSKIQGPQCGTWRFVFISTFCSASSLPREFICFPAQQIKYRLKKCLYTNRVIYQTAEISASSSSAPLIWEGKTSPLCFWSHTPQRVNAATVALRRRVGLCFSNLQPSPTRPHRIFDRGPNLVAGSNRATVDVKPRCASYLGSQRARWPLRQTDD